MAVVPREATFSVRCRTEGQDRAYTITRRQLPLTHAQVRTAQSAQGRTFSLGTVVHGLRADKPDEDNFWLAFYVMLSRATAIANLIIINSPTREFLERGPPERLRAALAKLLTRVRRRPA